MMAGAALGRRRHPTEKYALGACWSITGCLLEQQQQQLSAGAAPGAGRSTSSCLLEHYDVLAGAAAASAGWNITGSGWSSSSC